MLPDLRFPGETVQDTINGLEIIRQLMRNGLWSRRVSPARGHRTRSARRKPELFPIRLGVQAFGGFAKNFVPFAYNDGVRRSKAMHDGLSQALDNFRRGLYFDDPLPEWFPGLDVPAPTLAQDFVAETMKQPHPGARDRERLCWLGGEPTWSRGQLTVRASNGEVFAIAASREIADNLRRCHPSIGKTKTAKRRGFEQANWCETFRARGLVLV